MKGYFGHLSKLGVIDTKTIAAIVCTIEKANTLVNKLLEEGKLSDVISTVVVDELHMVRTSPYPPPSLFSAHPQPAYPSHLYFSSFLLSAAYIFPPYRFPQQKLVYSHGCGECNTGFWTALKEK